MKEKLLLFYIVLLTLCTAIVAAESSLFEQVPDNHWTYGELKNLSSYGLLPESSFANKELNRFEIGLLICHAMDSLKDKLVVEEDSARARLAERSLQRLVDEYQDALSLQPLAPFKDALSINEAILNMESTYAEQLLKLEKDLHKAQSQVGTRLSVIASGEYGKSEDLPNWFGLQNPVGEIAKHTMEVLFESRPGPMVSNEVTFQFNSNLGNVALRANKPAIKIKADDIIVEIGSTKLQLSPLTLTAPFFAHGWEEYYPLLEQNEMQRLFKLADLDGGQWPTTGLKITSKKDNIILTTFGTIKRETPKQYLLGIRGVANLSDSNQTGFNIFLLADDWGNPHKQLWNQVSSLEFCIQSRFGTNFMGEMAYSKFDDDVLSSPREVKGSAIKISVARDIREIRASFSYRNVDPYFKSMGSQDFPFKDGIINSSIGMDFSQEQQWALVNEMEPLGVATPNRKGFELQLESTLQRSFYWGLRFLKLREISSPEDIVPLQEFTGTGFKLGRDMNRSIGFLGINNVELVGFRHQTSRDDLEIGLQDKAYSLIMSSYGINIGGTFWGRKLDASVDLKKKLEKGSNAEPLEKLVQSLALEYEIVNNGAFRLDLLARKNKSIDKLTLTDSGWKSFAAIRLSTIY